MPLSLTIAALAFALVATDAPPPIRSAAPPFPLCTRTIKMDCVVDGDTFRWQGWVIRLLDIDAPETHPAHCPDEKALGRKATMRLKELLDAGGWTLARDPAVHRDLDKYGRHLRLVAIGDTDAGSILVAEGLARVWTGRREPWCPG